MPLAIVWKKRSSSCFSTSVTRFASRAQLRVGVAHLGRQRRHQRVEEGLARAELVAVADRAAGDAAQHVAAALVAGDHAVDDGEGAGADVVGDDLQRRRLVVAVAARRRLDRLLRRRRAASRTGRSRSSLCTCCSTAASRSRPMPVSTLGLGSLCITPVVVAVELHEDVVPDLDVAVAVLRRASPAGRRRSRGRGRRRSRCTGRTGRCRPSSRSCRRRSARPCCRRCARCARPAGRSPSSRCRRPRRPRRRRSPRACPSAACRPRSAAPRRTRIASRLK